MSDSALGWVVLIGVIVFCTWLGHSCGQRNVPSNAISESIKAPGLGSNRAEVRQDHAGVYVRLDPREAWTLALPRETRIPPQHRRAGDHKAIEQALAGPFLPVLISDGYSERSYLVLDEHRRVWSFRIRYGNIHSHAYLLAMDDTHDPTFIYFDAPQRTSSLSSEW